MSNALYHENLTIVDEALKPWFKADLDGAVLRGNAAIAVLKAIGITPAPMVKDAKLTPNERRVFEAMEADTAYASEELCRVASMRTPHENETGAKYGNALARKGVIIKSQHQPYRYTKPANG